MTLQPQSISAAAFNDDDAGGNNYFAGKAIYIHKTSGSYANIYSDSGGVNLITQNGINNVTNDKGVFTFYIDGGEYYAQSDGERVGFWVTNAELIESYAIRAEDAAASAATDAKIFDTVALGEAAAVDYFSVISADDNNYLDLYKNETGVAVYKKSYPSSQLVNSIMAPNIWPDPFFENAFTRPFINSNDKSYFGTLNQASGTSPFNRPYLSYADGSNAQSIRLLADTSIMEGDDVSFRVLASFNNGSGQVSIYFRDSSSAILLASSKTLTSAQSGLQDVILPSVTVPDDTSKIEVRINQGNGGSVFGVAAGKGVGTPSFSYSSPTSKDLNLDVAEKNLWPDPFFRQYDAGVTHHNGWTYAQVAGLPSPPIITTSTNSPFKDGRVLRMPVGSGQFDTYIDVKNLGVKAGDTITVLIGMYSKQTVNISAFGRTIDGTPVGGTSNTSFTFQAVGELRELQLTVPVDSNFVNTVDRLNVRIGNGLTVGSTPIDIYGRGVFVNSTSPLLYDDTYDQDNLAIQEFRNLPWNTQTMRETQMQVSRLKYNSIDSAYSLAIIGDSFTHLRQRYTEPLAVRLQDDLGYAGAGWIGFGNPDSGTGNINGSVLSTPTVTVSGGEVPSSNYATAESPDICSVLLDGNSGQYRVNSFPSGTTSLSLLAKKQVGMIEFSVDGGVSWTQIDLSSGDSISVNYLTVPATSFNLWVRYVSGNVELYGLVHESGVNGAIIHKLGATGSTAQQWAAQVTSSAFREGLSELSPSAVAIMLATNDQTSSRDPKKFQQDIKTIIDNVKMAVPTADILLLSPPDNQRGSNVAMPAYSSVMRSLAIEYNIAFHDYQQDYGTDPQSYAFDSDRPWFSSDLTHPNPAVGGGLPLAERIRKIIYNG